MTLETEKTETHVPPVITLLSEHLDQVLAAAEDLAKLQLPPRDRCTAGGDETAAADQQEEAESGSEAAPETVDDFVQRAQRLELSVAMRVLCAREYARELKRQDARFGKIADLFLGGTNPLADSLQTIAEPAGNLFETGGCPVGYLKDRGLIAKDAAAPDPFKPLVAGEEFRIVSKVELGALMDLVASFLDAIEIHYDVFPADGAADTTIAPELSSRAA